MALSRKLLHPHLFHSIPLAHKQKIHQLTLLSSTNLKHSELMLTHTSTVTLQRHPFLDLILRLALQRVHVLRNQVIDAWLKGRLQQQS